MTRAAARASNRCCAAPVERLSRVALLCRRSEGRWHVWRDVDGPSPDATRLRELLDAG